MKISNTISLLRWLTALAIVVLLIIVTLRIFNSPDTPDAKMTPAVATDLRGVMELCSVEIVEDYPVRAHIGKKHIFARIRVNANITFDIDSLRSELRGDTLYVTLPPEKVRVTESTDPDAYRVIDTWNDRFLGSDNFTTSEENAVKRAAARSFVRSVYARGHVRRARKEAAATLARVAGSFTGARVVVIDPSPAGYPPKKQ